MYKDVLRSIDDISLFPVIAILIFFVFFLLLGIRVVKMDKKHVNKMSSLPLDEEGDYPPIFPLSSNG
ncbi:MAG: hypothetical protein AAF824_18175 [Bacteroidota bacterium]